MESIIEEKYKRIIGGNFFFSTSVVNEYLGLTLQSENSTAL